MKRKLLLISVVLSLFILLLPACTSVNVNSSIKAITKPYIAQYECTEARYGETNILEYYEYIKINFLNKDEFEVIYKSKNGEQKKYSGVYSVDSETRELEGDLGILGYKFKEKVKVENGQFTISKILGQKELFIKFEMK